MQFCVSIIYFILIALSVAQNVTVQQPELDRLLSRKQRFILFPKGVTLKFTAFLSKGFVATYPRGMSFLIEMAFYYPGPWQQTDLIPKRLRPTTTPMPKRVNPTQSVLVCIPRTSICYKAKPLPQKRIDMNTQNLIKINNNQQFINQNNTNIWTKYQKYDDPNYYNNKYSWKQPTNWQKWDKYNTPYQYSVEERLNSKHVATYRDRRALFKNFEGFNKIVGFAMKSCILRSICDAKLFLLPKGYSLIHDILRVVFSFPSLHGMQDEYSRVQRATFETCDKELQNKCPINLLHWFTNTYVIS